MNNNILIDSIRLDGEYKELLETYKKVSSYASPQPILLTGLCDGAADATYATLIADILKLTKKKAPVLPLMLLAVPLSLIPLSRMENVLKLLLPLRYAVSFLGVGISLFARKKEAAA